MGGWTHADDPGDRLSDGGQDQDARRSGGIVTRRGRILHARTVLISGVGVAGPALAWWLQHYGFVPTLVEQSPGLRQGGYLIDFLGEGFDVAQRMGLVPEPAAA